MGPIAAAVPTTKRVGHAVTPPPPQHTPSPSPHQCLPRDCQTRVEDARGGAGGGGGGGGRRMGVGVLLKTGTPPRFRVPDHSRSVRFQMPPDCPPTGL